MKTLYIFDFDDTLALTNSHVIVNDTLRLTSREFAKYRSSPTDRLDFSEFMDVDDGSLIESTVDAMEEAIISEGIENVFIVTARSAAGPVKRFLRKKGVTIPKIIATSGSENKARWLINKLMSSEYNRVMVYEDCRNNIRMLKDVVDEYNIETNKNIQYSSVCVMINESKANKKNLMLDRPTSHGGWPNGPDRGWTGKEKVADTIYNYLKDMKLVERALRNYIRNILIENCKKDQYWGIAGAGMIFVCSDDKTVFLQQRSMEVSGGAGQWAFPGGGIHPAGEWEDFYDTPINPEYILPDDSPRFLKEAIQEVLEECGSVPKHSIIDSYIYEDCGWKYKTFIAQISAAEKAAWQLTPTAENDWEVMHDEDGNPNIGWFSKSEFNSMDLFFGFTPELKSKVHSAI